MLRGCAEGAIKSLMVFGENVALSAPQSDRSAEALNKVEFLAVADLYLTETAQLADVVFPACSFLEKDGTFTSIERRVQRVRKVIEPVGESRSDLDIIAALASSMGGALSADPAEVMSEIAANVPGYETVSYAAMDESWAERLPCDDQTPALAPIPEASVETTADFPLRLVASRINFHQQTGTMSMRSSVLAREYPEAFAEMNETDAERLGLRPGRKIRISSKLGSLTRTLLPSDAVREGCLHVPHFFGGDSPNALASYECDPESGVPIYKGCAVRVEAVE
jgi:predicted molibdopterin-dependent oxidoreductase YjgC